MNQGVIIEARIAIFLLICIIEVYNLAQIITDSYGDRK